MVNGRQFGNVLKTKLSWSDCVYLSPKLFTIDLYELAKTKQLINLGDKSVKSYIIPVMYVSTRRDTLTSMIEN